MIRRIFLTGFLTFCLFFQSASITGLAADEAGTEQKTEPYTYSITFYHLLGVVHWEQEEK